MPHRDDLYIKRLQTLAKRAEELRRAAERLRLELSEEMARWRADTRTERRRYPRKGR